MADEPAPARLIELEASFNFRDLGGYVGAAGRSVRWRRLFRADGLYRLTPADLELLGAFGLRTVIDLRTTAELDQTGRITWPTGELAFHHLPLMDVLPDDEDYSQWAHSAYVAEQYGQMLVEGGPVVGAVFDLLADPDNYPLAYHCMVGKDRTGVVSALVLSVLGVSDDVVAADYALSEAAMIRMMEWIRINRSDLFADLETKSASIVAAAPETMALFLKGVEATYGGAVGYLDSIGRGGVAERLRELLLEPAEPNA
jgi:protein-tyrosine phosphatase